MKTCEISISRQNTMKKKSTFYFLISAVVLFFILLAGEMLARWFVTPVRIPAPPPLSVIDPYKGNPYMTFMRPYFQFHIPGGEYIQARSYFRIKYEINSMGFRGPEFLEKKRTGLKRLLIIGDSMVEGHGCEFTNTFSYRLGEKGRKHGWEVLNIGVQGANPIYYAANVERYLSLRPDAVLLVLFENDVFEDRIQEGRFFNLPVLDNENALLMGHATKKFLFKSHLYVLLRRIWKKNVRSPFEKIVARNLEAAKELETIPVSEKSKKALEITPHIIVPEKFDKQWSMTEKYLDYALASFRREGVPVMIANLVINGIAPGGHEGNIGHAYTLNKKAAAWAAEENLPFLSLRPIFADAWKEHQIEDLSIKDDGHPTPAAHAIIERALIPWLAKHLANE